MSDLELQKPNSSSGEPLDTKGGGRALSPISPISTDQLQALRDASPTATVSWMSAADSNPGASLNQPLDWARALRAAPARASVIAADEDDGADGAFGFDENRPATAPVDTIDGPPPPQASGATAPVDTIDGPPPREGEEPSRRESRPRELAGGGFEHRPPTTPADTIQAPPPPRPPLPASGATAPVDTIDGPPPRDEEFDEPAITPADTFQGAPPRDEEFDEPAITPADTFQGAPPRDEEFSEPAITPADTFQGAPSEEGFGDGFDNSFGDFDDDEPASAPIDTIQGPPSGAELSRAGATAPTETIEGPPSEAQLSQFGATAPTETIEGPPSEAQLSQAGATTPDETVAGPPPSLTGSAFADSGPKSPLSSKDSKPISRGSLLRAGTGRLPMLKAATKGKASDTQADFVLRQKIGQGGQAYVWRAYQTSLAREVAVKRMIAPDGVHIIEFLQEAYTSAELDHPNIVPVYDLGRVSENGVEQPLLAMKLVRGTPWNVQIKSDRERSGFALEAYLAKHLPILIDVCNAVAYAHSKGIIHRDLKPHQVMVGEFGETFLMDWGLAVSLRVTVPTVSREGIPKHHTLNTASNCCGTPAYMAPEQTLETTGKLGYSTDVYLLGAILFELIAGTPPHWKESAREAFDMASRNELLALPENCPPDLRELLETSLDSDPEKRPETAKEFREGLESYLGGSSRRREARELVESVAADAAGNPSPGYRDLTDRLAKLDRALAMWPETAEALPLRENVLETFVVAALENGDLALADAQAKRLEDGARKTALLEVVGVRERDRTRRERQRRALMGAAAAFLLCLAALGIKAESLRRDAVKEAAKARYGEYVSNAQFARICLQDGRPDQAERYLVDAPKDLVNWEWGYLLRRCQMEIQSRLFRHEARASALAPGGRIAGAALDIGAVTLWDIQGEREERWLAGHEEPVNDIRFSGEGGLAATASDDGTARIWDFETGEEKFVLRGHAGPVREVAFGPDAEFAATASSDGTAKLWSLETGEEIKTFAGPGAEALGVAVGPRGKLLAVCFSDGTGKVWDIESGEEKASIDGSKHGAMASIRLDSYGALVAAGHADGSVNLWFARNGKLKTALAGHLGAVGSAEFSPDGDLLLTASADGFLKVWDAASGRETASMDAGAAKFREARFDPDGEKIIALTTENRVVVWNAFLLQKSRATLPDSEGPALDAVFSPDRNRVAAAGEDGKVRLWVSDTLRELRVLEGFQGAALSVRFDAEGKRLLAAGEDGSVRVWEALSGREVATLRTSRSGAAREAVFSPDGTLAAAAMENGSVAVWNLESGEKKLEIMAHEKPVRGVAFSPDGKRLATASDDGTAKVWSLAEGADNSQPLAAFVVSRGGAAKAVAFSPDGTRVATASQNGDARIWDARGGAALQTFRGHSGPVNTVSFGPRGLRLVTASEDGSAKVWDAVSGRELASLPGHVGEMASARFSLDGKQIVTAGRDGRVVVWDTAPF